MSSQRSETLRVLRMYQCVAAQEGNEQFGAARGLVYGSPLTDVDLVDFSLRVPQRALTDGKRSKHLLRMVAYDRLPDEIQTWRNRSADLFFGEDELELIQEAFPPSAWMLAEMEIVDPSAVQTLFERAASDATMAWQLIEVIAAEAVVRNLTCPISRSVTK